MTPLENLRLALELDGFATDHEPLIDALRRLGLQGREELLARYLSTGQKRRVVLARLLPRPADLWVLDEPFNSLDTAATELLGTLVAHHLEAAGIAVLTSHQPVPLANGLEIVL